MTDPRTFLRTLFEALAEQAVDVSAFALDHLCYRVETPERYEELRKEMDAEHVLLAESRIGGRCIATYRVQSPWLFESRWIDVVEFPHPSREAPIRKVLSTLSSWCRRTCPRSRSAIRNSRGTSAPWPCPSILMCGYTSTGSA